MVDHPKTAGADLCGDNFEVLDDPLAPIVLAAMSYRLSRDFKDAPETLRAAANLLADALVSDDPETADAALLALQEAGLRP